MKTHAELRATNFPKKVKPERMKPKTAVLDGISLRGLRISRYAEDTELKSFSIERYRSAMLPMIKRAQEALNFFERMRAFSEIGVPLS